MRKEEFYVLNSLYNGSIGRAGCTYDVEATKALNDTDIYNKLVKKGYFKKESVYFYGGNFACGYFLPDDADNVGKSVRDEKCIRESTF